MRTIYITLDRSAERVRHIQKHVLERQLNFTKISAIDGQYLSREILVQECDIEKVEKYRGWLTDGAIGCALSHKLAYQEFLKSTDQVAFIIEDDIVLPPNIKTILDDISREIKSNEVILLYYTSFEAAEISRVKSVEFPEAKLGLYFPVNIKQPITAAAYCIGRKAAKGILKANTPITVTADSWGDLFFKNAFDSLRVLYPSPLKTKNFKSSINYFRKGSLKYWLSEIVNAYRIPIIYQYLKMKRASRLNDMLNHFSLVDTESQLSVNAMAIRKTNSHSEE